MGGAGGKTVQLKGTRFTVRFLGCRVNAAEAEALSSLLAARGAVEDRDHWDLAVLVTCGVTAMADRKSRQAAAALRRANPRGCLVVTGCWAQEASPEQAQALGVDLLVGNRLKGRIVELLEAYEGGFQSYHTALGGLWDPLQAQSSTHHTRAFIKVQDGCDLRCSYCIVPTLRGPSVSRPLGDLLDECRRLLDKGVSELVLTGVHLGLWGKERGETLADLVQTVGSLPGLKRLRFGSLEPFGVTDRLLDALARCGVFAPHLHLPLQSGSATVLKAMRRPGTPEEFVGLARRAREVLGENLHISTDVMVGYPGETEEDFIRTLEVLEAARVGRVHGFIFSSRPGTPASFLAPVDKSRAKDRLDRLLAASKKALQHEALLWVGRPNTLLVEREGKGLPGGYNQAWIEVLCPPLQPRGQWLTAVPVGASDGVLYLHGAGLVNTL